MKKANIFKPGTKKYYRDALSNIVGMAVDYDGFNSVEGLKSLIDDMRAHASKALNHEKLYIQGTDEKTETKKIS